MEYINKIDNIKTRIILPSDCDEVLKLTMEHYYRDEPLSCCEPKLVEVPDSERIEILEACHSGISIMAVQETDEGEELLGYCLAAPREPGYVEELLNVAYRDGIKTKYSRILQMLALASRKADIFNRYGVNKILYFYMSCVAPKARRKHLSLRLKKEVMSLGKSLGYKVFKCDCTGYYSALVTERMGMELVYTMLYKDFVDENNKPIFKVSPPHEGLKVYAMRVD